MQRASDRWLSITLSVLLHGALLAALVYGWLLIRQPAPAPQPPIIDAQVVDARAAQGVNEPAPPAEQAEDGAGPLPPITPEMAQRELEREQAEWQEAEQKAAEQRKLQEQKEQEERERAAQEKQRAEDEKERSEREADLRRSLAEEEHAAAVRASAALAAWQSLIAARITHAWLRPPTARPGIRCVLYVTQVPGGEVTQVKIGQCNGDQAVRESIETAVYRASPLPPPPDPALFDRNLTINFKPD